MNEKMFRAEMSDAELLLWSRLETWPATDFCRQYPIGSYIADIASASARLAIEIAPIADNQARQFRYEIDVDGYVAERGWRLLRLRSEEILEHIEDVLDYIADQLPPEPMMQPLTKQAG
jgi:very-short-patch-repair endonuclease